MEYAKPWLSLDDQVSKLQSRGVQIREQPTAVDLLRRVGYYRLTGYLYPFRESTFTDTDGQPRIHVLNCPDSPLAPWVSLQLGLNRSCGSPEP